MLLFTYAVIRAVHLEVVTELSAEHVLLAIRRFVARRGKPKLIISDNAKGFQLAKKVLTSTWTNVLIEDSIQHYFSEMKIEWKFIVEYAPWMGGFYERMVGTVKRSLRKTIRKACLNLMQLLTIITEAEAIVNSRPLTYVSSEIEDKIALTLADFLMSNTRFGLCVFDPLNELNDQYKPRDSTTIIIFT